VQSGSSAELARHPLLGRGPGFHRVPAGQVRPPPRGVPGLEQHHGRSLHQISPLSPGIWRAELFCRARSAMQALHVAGFRLSRRAVRVHAQAQCGSWSERRCSGVLGGLLIKPTHHGGQRELPPIPRRPFTSPCLFTKGIRHVRALEASLISTVLDTLSPLLSRDTGRQSVYFMRSLAGGRDGGGNA